MELLAIVLMLLWTEVVVMMAHGREFGFPKLNFILPGAVLVVHFFATMYWFGETRAAIRSDACSQATVDKTDTPQICGEFGPSLAIANCVLISAATVLFTLVYANRGKVYVKVREAELVRMKSQESDQGSTEAVISNRA